MVKKGHRLKCTVLSRKNKWISYVSKLKPGKVHDYKMLQTDFPPSLNWFNKLIVHLDLIYQGFEDDYSAKTILMRFKRNKKNERCDLKKSL